MNRFTIPRDVYHGPNAIDALKKLEGHKAFVVVGCKSMKQSGYLDKVINNLKEAKFEVKVYEGVEPDPSIETVKKGAKMMLEFQPDWIVSIGGGSTIDAGKTMWCMYEHPEASFESLLEPFKIPTLRHKAHYCAITSTSGTGTEVTDFAVITDYQKGIKFPLASYELTPDVAIVDHLIPESMPPKLVAFTGMDALTHSIEAYVSTVHCEYTDALALHSIKLIQNNLINSFHEDMNARHKMCDAQCMAGMAFSNALLGIVHSMAHKTGAAFSGGHIVHGCANAMYLPKVIKYNSKNAEAAERYAEIARFMGLKGNTTTELVDALISEIDNMNKKLQIPKCIKEYEGGIIDEKEFNDKNAILDACTGTNPRIPTQEEMEKLLLCVFYDRPVDF